MPVPPDPRDGPGGGRSREGFPPGRDTDSDSDTDTGETPAVRWVQLLAPSDLPGGYELDVFCDGLVVAAVVPEGGVRAGEAFSVPFLPPLEALAVLVPGAGEDKEGKNGGETETEPTEATRLLLPENGPGGGESGGEPLGAEASGQRGGGGCCCCFRGC